jgi:hypothetical protein
MDNQDKKEALGKILSKYRELLNEEISKIDPNIIVELAVGPHLGDDTDPTKFFSDWPDTWNDGGRWVKTWGKGGGDVQLRPLEELRQRLQIAKIEQNKQRK